MGKTDVYTSDPRVNQTVGNTITERQDTVKRGQGRERLNVPVQGIWGIPVRGVRFEWTPCIHLLVC